MVFRAAASLLILVVAVLSFAGLDPLRPSTAHRQLGPAVARAGTDNQDNAAADNQDNLASDNQGSSSDLDNLLAELDNLGVTIIIGGGSGSGSGSGSGIGSGTITTDNGSATFDNGNVTVDEDGGNDDNGDNLDNFDFD